MPSLSSQSDQRLNLYPIQSVYLSRPTVSSLPTNHRHCSLGNRPNRTGFPSELRSCIDRNGNTFAGDSGFASIMEAREIL